jgi:hypothetical protein
MPDLQDWKQMAVDPFALLGPAPTNLGSEVVRARWARLTEDFLRLPLLTNMSGETRALRDAGALLLLGHDDALSDAESYVVEGHTARTGHVVEYDDIDDEVSLERWAKELDRASSEGFAPPAPPDFWSSFLHWRTPLGMARLTERRIRSRRS